MEPMAKRHMYYDKTEITLAMRMGNGYSTFHVPAEKVQRIKFSPMQAKKLFRKIESEMISIEAAGFPPLMLFKHEEGEFFETYKEELRKFGKENHISVIEETAGSAAD